jgi:PAS domain S-box-containing protein
MKPDQKTRLTWLGSIVLALGIWLLAMVLQARENQNTYRKQLLTQATLQLEHLTQRIQQLTQAGQTATELLVSTNDRTVHNSFEHYAPYVLASSEAFDFVALIERISPAQRQAIEEQQSLSIREFQGGQLGNAGPRAMHFVATLQHPDDGKALPSRLDLGAEPAIYHTLVQASASGQPVIARIHAGNLQRMAVFFSPKAKSQAIMVMFGLNNDALLAKLNKDTPPPLQLRLRLLLNDNPPQLIADSHPGQATTALPLLSASRIIGGQRISFELSPLNDSLHSADQQLPLALGALLALGVLIAGGRYYNRSNLREIHSQNSTLSMLQQSNQTLRLHHAQQQQRIKPLQEAEERYRHALHDAADGMLLLSAQGEVLEVNPAAAALIGQPRDALLQLPAGALISELHCRNGLRFEQHASPLLGLPFEAMLICDQSFMLQVELSLSLIRPQLSEPVYLVVCRNIAARKEREAALIRLKDSLAERVETQNRQLTALLDASPMAMAYIVDRQFKQVNKAFLELFAREESSTVDHSTRLIYDSDEHYLRTGRLIYPLLYEGQVTQNTLRLQRGDGNTLWVNMYGRAVKSDTPGLGSVWLYQDISTQRNTEEALRQARDLAEETSRAKTEFLANMSHELRTPLHAILGFAEMGEARSHGGDGTKIAHCFERIHNSGSRLLSLLNDLLDLAKMEVGKMDYQLSRSDLEQVVREAVEDLRGQASQCHVTLVQLPAPSRLLAEMDPFRIGQVVRNLLANAIKFSPRGSRVEIGFSLTPGQPGLVNVYVRDHGPGVPPGEQERIFDKFIQSSLTKTGAGGTGLGLAISREIISAHQGLISVHNAADGGAIFSFTLPQTHSVSHKES